MQVEDILSKLENNTGVFPRRALERAIEEKEAITPFLLSTLSECKDDLENVVNKDAYILHIYALFLLAQFRESKAYPLIIDFFSAPGDISLDATGDVVTEDLSRILASVSHGNIEPIKTLIENQEVNEFVRGAAIRSLIILVLQEIIPREQVVEYFKEIFSTLFANQTPATDTEKEPDFMWTDLVINGSILCPAELKEYIERTFDEELIDPFFFDRDDFNYYLQLGSEKNLQKLRNDPHNSLVEDAISDMESWSCFDREVPRKFQKHNNIMEIEGFAKSVNKSKNKAKKKKKMQKESRKKNRKNKK